MFKELTQVAQTSISAKLFSHLLCVHVIIDSRVTSPTVSKPNCIKTTWLIYLRYHEFQMAGLHLGLSWIHSLFFCGRMCALIKTTG